MSSNNGYSSQYIKPKQGDEQNQIRVIGIHAGGHQTFVRVSDRVRYSI
jgi:hypothetical protein